MLLDTLNQRVPLDEPSIARTSNVQSEKELDMGSFSLIKRQSVMPLPKDKLYKLKTYSKTKTQKKVALL